MIMKKALLLTLLGTVCTPPILLAVRLKASRDGYKKKYTKVDKDYPVGPGTSWGFIMNAGATKGTIQFLDVTDSDASGSNASHKPIDPLDSIDGGGTTDWFVEPYPMDGRVYGIKMWERGLSNSDAKFLFEKRRRRFGV